MSCCASSGSTIIAGTSTGVSFQLSTNGRAYRFEDATLVTCQLISTDYSSFAGPKVTCLDAGDADWRSGFGVANFADKDTATIPPGQYRLQIETTQPGGKKVWRTSDTVIVFANP